MVAAGSDGTTGVAFCAGCGRPAAECGGCTSPSDTWHYCPSCGRWLAVQVTPTGWTTRCRGCGAHHRGSHR
jgi:hypothetical protein